MQSYKQLGVLWLCYVVGNGIYFVRSRCIHSFQWDCYQKMTLKSVFCSVRKMCQLMQAIRFPPKRLDMILFFDLVDQVIHLMLPLFLCSWGIIMSQWWWSKWGGYFWWDSAMQNVLQKTRITNCILIYKWDICITSIDNNKCDTSSCHSKSFSFHY